MWGEGWTALFKHLFGHLFVSFYLSFVSYHHIQSCPVQTDVDPLQPSLNPNSALLMQPGEPDAVNLEEKVSTVAAQKLVLESDEGT